MSSDSSIIEEQRRTNPGFDALKDLIDQCAKMANQHGERFNIFSILGVERDETTTHSKFIAELLKPSGRHGEEIRFLRVFIEQILNLPAVLTGKVRVTRELSTEYKRRVDIVVETPELILGIEVKIGAGDQEAQLRDYHRELKRRANGRKTVALAYLTLNGKKPSKYSLQDLAPESVRCLSFSEDIPRWLTICGEHTLHKPELSYALKQYQRLLQNLTGTGTSMKSLLANELLSNREALVTALKAEEALPLAKSKVMLKFWEDLVEGLTEAFGIRPAVYGGKNLKEISDNYFKKGKKLVGIKLPICELRDETISLYVHINSFIHYGLRVEADNGKVFAKPDLRDRVQKNLRDGNAKANNHPDWLVCYYNDPASSQPFSALNFHAFGEPVQDLIDDATRKQVIGAMIEHQVSLKKAMKVILESSADMKLE